MYNEQFAHSRPQCQFIWHTYDAAVLEELGDVLVAHVGSGLFTFADHICNSLKVRETWIIWTLGTM
jgi:hypothetical protein